MLKPRFPFLDHRQPLAFAHRGGGLENEENTLAAFAHAVSLGFHYIETDVRASRDGVPVIFHDDTLARMTGEAGRIGDYDWDDLARIRTRGGEPFMRLDDALAHFPATRFNIEPKSDAAVEPVAEVILRCNAVDRVCIGGFDLRRTLRLRDLLGGDVCWSPSYRGALATWLAGWGLPMRTGSFPVLQIPLDYRGIPIATPRFLEAAHARNMQVHVWTVNNAGEMDRLLDMGVDGLMSDRPSLLREVLVRRGAWAGGVA